MTDDSIGGDNEPSVAARDELAGVVDLFGALTRSELSRALSELAFKRRTEIDDAAIDAAIDAGLEEYYLVAAPDVTVGDPDATVSDPDVSRDDPDVSRDDPDEPFLVAGPTAFPALPQDAGDLPHILDVSDREIDRERLATTVLDRLRDDAIDAITNGDDERLETLIDVTYDLEAWAPVDPAPIRDRIVDEVG